MTNQKSFSEKTVNQDPFTQFKIWYEKHLDAGIAIPESVTLATSTIEGKVSARTVLLKDFNVNGFVFFTNYKSRKGNQLIANPNAALLFYWPESGRQIRIEGITEKVSEEESVDYFTTRPRESQLSAWASEQSSVIPNRRHLNKRFNFYREKYLENPVDKPSLWGGFRLKPLWFEFWQDGEFRLHDRIIYTKRDDLWIIERLAP